MHSVSSFGDEIERPPLRPLDAVEARVLGALLEKQQTTPEYYPMTLNALVAACNQKSNREPVMELSDQDVAGAIERLTRERLVREVAGARSRRWEHVADYRLSLGRREKALLTLLLLRGPQTAGELRGRSERMHEFATVNDAEDALAALGERSTPLVVELPRRPGQKEARWAHLLSGTPDVPAETQSVSATVPAEGTLASRVSALEDRIARLTETLEDLRRKLGE